MGAAELNMRYIADCVADDHPTIPLLTTSGLQAGPLLLVVIDTSGGPSLSFPLPESGEVTVGRSAESDISIDDRSLSRRHATIHVGDGGSLAIKDLDSSNGTKVRNTRIPPRTPVAFVPGEAVDLGQTLIVVKARSRVPAAAPVSEPLPVPAKAGRDVLIADPAMARLYHLAERIASGTISVLLLGETGAGKEVLAQAIHRMSPRGLAPFIGLNCAAFSETLLESELFGHEKGAFTGAVVAKPGLFETANGGTVFLDEIGELTPGTQAKLLRALETRQVQRVGGLRPRNIDVRFLAATNRDLERDLDTPGGMRRDLYFRIAGFTLEVPPLRERPGEIRPLAERFLQRAVRPPATVPRLSAEALALLEQHHWPGNIRELKNVMERALLLGGAGGEVQGEHLILSQPKASTPPPAPSPPGKVRDEMDALERTRILDALAQCAGNQTQAARLLGMSRRTLLYRLDAYGVARPRKKE